MTREELRARCEALASVGDEQARETIKVLDELRDLKCKEAESPVVSLEKLARLRGNAIYILARVANALALAPELIGYQKESLPQALVELAEGYARTPEGRRLNEHFVGEAPTPKSVEGDPEAAAAAATRAANGLPAVQDPGCYEADTDKAISTRERGKGV